MTGRALSTYTMYGPYAMITSRWLGALCCAIDISQMQKMQNMK